MRRHGFWLFFCLALLPVGCGQNLGSSGVRPGTPAVRVLLLESKQRIDLSAIASPRISVAGSPSTQVALPTGSAVPVTLTPTGWRLGDVALGNGALSIDPAADGSVSVNGHAYRGRYRFVPTSGDRFDVVNDVDIEGYLKGVLSEEMLKNWHDEAYKAQAIVARTYALYVARTNPSGRHYDLFCDQRSQVYGGIGRETRMSRTATDETRGIVVAWGPPGREKIFKAYFSSCCGGVTQSAADAFGDATSEPLSDQRIGPRCAASKWYNWGPVTIKKVELTRRVRAWGVYHQRAEYRIGQINRVDVQFSNRWGRPTRFVVTDSGGTPFSLSGEEFRTAFNFDATDHVTLPSSYFKPVNDRDVIRITEGHGYGHGVGLCQWCAEEEAVHGTSGEEIVVAAFPHSRLVRAY